MHVNAGLVLRRGVLKREDPDHAVPRLVQDLVPPLGDERDVPRVRLLAAARLWDGLGTRVVEGGADHDIRRRDGEPANERPYSGVLPSAQEQESRRKRAAMVRYAKESTAECQHIVRTTEVVTPPSK